MWLCHALGPAGQVEPERRPVVCEQVLFELARYHAPSTIFLDELEALMSHRVSSGG